MEHFDVDGRTKVDFDVEFFHGTNEDHLFATTYASLRSENDIPKFVRALNDFFLQQTADTFNHGSEPMFRVKTIRQDGCDDIGIVFEDGSEMPSDSEATFKDLLDTLSTRSQGEH